MGSVSKLLSGMVTRASGDDVGEAVQQAADAVDSIFTNGFWGFLLLVGIAAAVCFVLIKLLDHFVARRISGNMRIFYRLLSVIIIAVAVMVVLSAIKPLQRFGTALLAGSGIAAAVIGLAAQQTLGNLFSGLSISANKPFQVGEIVEVIGVDPTIIGKVKEIGLRHTVITDRTNKNVVIPNSVLDKEIIRTSHSLDPDGIVNYLTVGVSYNSDLDMAIETLQRLCDTHPDSMDVRTAEEKAADMPKTLVHVTDLGESVVNLRASVWSKDANIGFNAVSDLRRTVLKVFADRGIDMPYPYRNIVLTDTREQPNERETHT